MNFHPEDVALITGASSGIGWALALALDKYGIKKVILVARRTHKLHELSNQLRCESQVFTCDLSDAEQRATLLSQLPPIDILINNAGFGRKGTFGDQPLKLMLDMVELHASTTLALCHAALPHMRKKNRGFILNVGSSIGEISVPNSSVYSATKAFINNFTESLRIEELDNGINTMLLAPGPIGTEFFKVSKPGRKPPKIALDVNVVAKRTLKLLQSDVARYMPDWKIRLLVTSARHMPRSLFSALMYRNQQKRTPYAQYK